MRAQTQTANPRANATRNAGAPQAVATAAIARHLYRLTLLCDDGDVGRLGSELRDMLRRHRLVPLHLARQPLQRPQTRIVLRVASSILERAALVRIVNELAADPGVRCLQWETDPRS